MLSKITKNKILILGGTGFIGFAIAKKFHSKKYFIDIVGSKKLNDYDLDFQKFVKKKNVAYLQINLRNQNFLIKDHYKFIFNFASIVGVKNVESNPVKTLDVNYKIYVNIIKKILNFKKLEKYIFASSAEVSDGFYELTKKIPSKEDDSIVIKDIFHSRASYLISKIMGEKLLINSNINFLILRLFNIYGPRMSTTNVIVDLINKLNHNKKTVKVYSPEHKRTFCYIDDCVNMIYSLSISGAKRSTFNIGTNKDEITIFELAKKILKYLNKNKILQKSETKESSVIRRVPSLNKIKKNIKVKFSYNLDKGLKKTISWYIKNK